jgi:hypothetical protein
MHFLRVLLQIFLPFILGILILISRKKSPKASTAMARKRSHDDFGNDASLYRDRSTDHGPADTEWQEVRSKKKRRKEVSVSHSPKTALPYGSQPVRSILLRDCCN